MSDLEIKRGTQNALKAFATQPLKVVATGLFIALGYTQRPARSFSPSLQALF
ncbi:MAG: hypothetical protein Q8O70_05605 [Burkholderiales bacterium]|nr:hypothetical protein [Burkholderiales bacterium]